MQTTPTKTVDAGAISAAFEHSITWEDDVWRADPVDVEAVHKKARQRFAEVLKSVTEGQGGNAQNRMLLFHGQSGAGKTHLIRALRTKSHRAGTAYFGYAQMTPDVGNYADYFLRRLIASLEKPYDPEGTGKSALSRLTEKLVKASDTIAKKDLTQLRDGDLEADALARLVLKVADDVVAAPEFAEQSLDINIVRALLYLERKDPRIDARIRQYLYGRPLNELSQASVAALDPNVGEARAFEIIESLGRLMWTAEGAALVYCIDQVEDLRFFADPSERFQKAVRDLIQIINRVPSAIAIVSVLGDFYEQVRATLPQSYIDRLEKSGPVLLTETRTAEEARLILAKRLAGAPAAACGDPIEIFGPQFSEEFAGLSTRRLLEHAQTRCRDGIDDDEAPSEPVSGPAARSPAAASPPATAGSGGFISALANALGLATAEPVAPESIDFREIWQRFHRESEAEIAMDEGDLLETLSLTLQLAKDEWGGNVEISVRRLDTGGEVAAADVAVRHKSTGYALEKRLFICNRSTQGGGLKRQLDKVLALGAGKQMVMLRASDFPPNRKNQTALAFRKFREVGGQAILVPLYEWERMMTVKEFHARQRHTPGFAKWLEEAKLVSDIPAIAEVLRLDLLGRAPPRADQGQAAAAPITPASGSAPALPVASGEDGAALAPPAQGDPLAPASDAQWGDWLGIGSQPMATPANDDDLPLSALLGDEASAATSVLAGRVSTGRPVQLSKDIFKRHAAVLGGSGSGKTTLALSLIEQLLLKGIPAILIDRKGDLCSYANPDVWRSLDGETAERRSEREKLGDAIDVAVYTPGRASGRPISITLLPHGIRELPDHEQLLLANLSAAALGEMLHLKNSATHQKQSGTLSVALKILGSRYNTEVTLADLIHLLEDEDPELTDLTQRMDPSGKIRRDLVAQLDSLRHRNSALFEGGGEPLRMEAFLGRGAFAREGRTRLSVIYTGFLGDNENILFWVSQFLSEALRFCQRNPNDELQAVVMFDEADLYIPANSKPATAEPLQSLLKRARSAGLGMMLATQSPGDLDYKSRDQITSWFIGRVREDTALRKLRAAFQSDSGLDPTAVLPGQTVGEFHLVQERLVRSMKAQRSLINAEQVPFDRIEQLARETRGHDETQLKLFDLK